ncbi:serine--tRNA ligase, partial [Candidatus Woesearchaeota archaeon]|nr:serine--tRNA ligase [Candidatus Woesearchaeota archaeon]
MLSIKFLRENADAVRADIKKRGMEDSLKNVDEVLSLDEKNRKIQFELDALRHEKNELSLEVNRLKKTGEDADEVLKKVKVLPEKVKKLEEEREIIEEKLKKILMNTPNILHQSVPVGKGSEGNVVVRTWGTRR